MTFDPLNHVLLDINEVDDDDDYWESICACGWASGEVEGEESAVDAHAVHVFNTAEENESQ